MRALKWGSQIMDSNTEKLIRELADKLGITAGHLWAALVRQAPISGTVDLLMCVVVVALLVCSYRRLRRFDPGHDFRELFCGVWFLWGAAAFSTSMVIGSSLSKIAAAFFNPEYWALRQLIDNIQ
jgi:hypothetical protein